MKKIFKNIENKKLLIILIIIISTSFIFFYDIKNKENLLVKRYLKKNTNIHLKKYDDEYNIYIRDLASDSLITSIDNGIISKDYLFLPNLKRLIKTENNNLLDFMLIDIKDNKANIIADIKKNTEQRKDDYLILDIKKKERLA